jgi:hypothetical protein
MKVYSGEDNETSKDFDYGNSLFSDEVVIETQEFN